MKELTKLICDLIDVGRLEFLSEDHEREWKNSKYTTLLRRYPNTMVTEESLIVAVSTMYPKLAKHTVEFIAAKLSSSKEFDIRTLINTIDNQSSCCDYVLIFLAVDAPNQFVVHTAGDWCEARVITKRLQSPDHVCGFKLLDIITNQSSLKYDLRNGYLYRIIEPYTNDGDTYDMRGYVIKPYDTRITISGVGQHDELFSIIKQAMEAKGIDVKVRCEDGSLPIEIKEPEGVPHRVAIICNSHPIGG